MAARASTSSAKRSPGGIEMPPPPPVPPRTASRSPPLPPPDILTAGDAKGTGTTADPLPSTGHVARGSKQTPGWPGTEPAGSRPALRLETAAPTLSPVLSISSNPTEDSYPSTMASPSTDPPDDAEVLNDGSRLYRLPRQCMRYTQRLDGSWKQWGPMMLPDGDSTSSEQVCPSTDMADMKLKLHEAESRAAQLQAAVGQAARQGKAQCEQFEQRLREMEADVIQSVALGSDERTRVQIERLQTRVHHLEIEAEDLRTEAMVARAASDKNRAAMQKAKRAAETSHKQIMKLEATSSKSASRDDAARARWRSRAEDASAAQKAAAAAAAAATEKCAKLTDRVEEVEAALAKSRGEASAYKDKLSRCENSLHSLQPSLDAERSTREEAQAALAHAKQQLTNLRAREAEWEEGRQKQMIVKLKAQLDAQGMVLQDRNSQLNATEHELRMAQAEQTLLAALVHDEKKAAEMAVEAQEAAEAHLSTTELDISTAQIAAHGQLEEQEVLSAQLEDELARATTDRKSAVETLAAQVESTAVLRDRLAELDTELAAAQDGASELASQRVEITRLKEQLVLEAAEAEQERQRLKQRAADPLLWKADRLLHRLDEMEDVARAGCDERHPAHMGAPATSSKSQAGVSHAKHAKLAAPTESVPIADRSNPWKGLSGVWHAVGTSSAGGTEEVWLVLQVDSDGRLTGHEAQQTEACVLQGHCGEDCCTFTQITGDTHRIWTARLTPGDSTKMKDGIWEGACTGFFEAVQVTDTAEDGVGDRDTQLASTTQGKVVEVRPDQLQCSHTEAQLGNFSGQSEPIARVLPLSAECDKESDQSADLDTQSSLLVDAAARQTSLLSVEREVRLLKTALESATEDTKAQLEQQSRKHRAKLDAELARLTKAHTKSLEQISKQHQTAQQNAETRLEFVKAAHAREVAKMTEQLEVAHERVYKLRQAQLLCGHDLSGIWRVAGVEPKSKQQVAIQLAIYHDVISGDVHGTHVPGDSVEFTVGNGRIVGNKLQWRQTFLDGQQEWQMRCERGFPEDVIDLAEGLGATASSNGAKPSAVDFTTVRASGEWEGAMQGHFTATRQIDQHTKSTEAAAATKTAAASPSVGDGWHSSPSPVAPIGWKKLPNKQVQLAFNGPAQKLHRLFARLDVTGEGTIPFSKLVSQLSQDDECIRMFDLLPGNDRASVSIRQNALQQAFAELPEAADVNYVDADGFVRLIMGATRPQVGSSRDTVLVSFTDPGTLGLKFRSNKVTGAVEILAVNSATQAAQYANLLQPGLVIQTVNGANVAGRDYSATIAAIKAAGRPVELGFKMQQNSVTQHASRTQTLEQKAEVAMIERDLLQRRCDQLLAQLRRRRQRDKLDEREQQYGDSEITLEIDEQEQVFDHIDLAPATPPPRGGSTTVKTAATAVGGLARLRQLAKKHSPVSISGSGERYRGGAADLSVSAASDASPFVDGATRV